MSKLRDVLFGWMQTIYWNRTPCGIPAEMMQLCIGIENDISGEVMNSDCCCRKQVGSQQSTRCIIGLLFISESNRLL
jgi:hypothetical protein